MTTHPSTQLELGPLKERKPSTAMNLSLFTPGLGQVYCGDMRRGLMQLSSMALLLVVPIVFLATQSVPPLPLIITFIGLSFIPMIYSGWDARRMALATREDYRLKDYNRLSVYVVLSFLIISLAVGVAFSVRDNFLHPFIMASNSMSPTLVEGERIFVRRDSYREQEPARNDLVAFLNPADRRQTWVKRVIGLPGDTVEMKSGTLYLNGEEFKEDSNIALDQDDIAPITIPDYHCYVLGDNRAKSMDSRHIGPVPMIALVGKVLD